MRVQRRFKSELTPEEHRYVAVTRRDGCFGCAQLCPRLQLRSDKLSTRSQEPQLLDRQGRSTPAIAWAWPQQQHDPHMGFPRPSSPVCAIPVGTGAVTGSQYPLSSAPGAWQKQHRAALCSSSLCAGCIAGFKFYVICPTWHVETTPQKTVMLPSQRAHRVAVPSWHAGKSSCLKEGGLGTG